MTEKPLSSVLLEKFKIKFEYEVHANKGNFQESHTQEWSKLNLVSASLSLIFLVAKTLYTHLYSKYCFPLSCILINSNYTSAFQAKLRQHNRLNAFLMLHFSF